MAYCENFACNLVSFRKLKRRGFWWDTRSDQTCLTCLKRADNSMFAYLKDQYNQFVLKDIPEDLSRGSFFTRRNKFNTYTRRKPRKALAHVWHQRLGHPGSQALEHLVNCSQGVRIKGPTTVQYDRYSQGKLRQQIRHASRFLNKDIR